MTTPDKVTDNSELLCFRRVLARGVAIIAALYVLVVFCLLVGNCLHMRQVDPLNEIALAELRQVLAKHPGDVALKEAIRTIDLNARRTFFGGAEFARTGAWLLLVGVLVLLGALKVGASLTRKLPHPGPVDEGKRDAARDARMAVTGAGVALLIAAVIMACQGPTLLPSPSRSGTPVPGPDPGSAIGDAAAEPPTQDELRRNWPGFRGVGGKGIAFAEDPPVTWDVAAGEGVVWRVEDRNPGFSSPVVWGSNVVLSGATDDGRGIIVCYDAASGDVRWRTQLEPFEDSPEEAPEVAEDTGHAAATPATDGRRIYAIFANGDLAALDLTGTLVWGKNIGVPDNHYGHSSSLVCHRDTLIVQYDHFQGSKLLAFDTATGGLKWEKTREVSISWASPVLTEVGDRTAVVLNAEPRVEAYDVETGEQLWSIECMGGEVAPSVAVGAGMVFAANEYAVLVALQANGSDGDGKVLWQHDEDLPEVSSPVATDDLLFVATSTGALTCYAAATGKELWQQEFDDGFYSSPILVDGKLYLVDLEGVMRVFAASATYELLGESELGEGCVATPAFANGRIYLRGVKHLLCLGK